MTSNSLVNRGDGFAVGGNENARPSDDDRSDGRSSPCGTDREFLCWIHDRLHLKFGDRPLMDFMHRLREIITTIPAEQKTPRDGRGKNSLNELIDSLQ